MNRRGFLAASAGGGALITGFDHSANPGSSPTPTLTAKSPARQRPEQGSYRGIRPVSGPAPRALPQVPVAVDDEGYLHGRWPPDTTGDSTAMTLGGVRYTAAWFQYCGYRDHPGFRPDADQDTYFRSVNSPVYDWQASAYESGERLHVSDFADYETWTNGVGTPGIGKPAVTTWRSQGLDGPPFRVHVLRSPKVSTIREAGDEWMDVSTTADGFIAWAAQCTHRCCTPVFKQFEKGADLNLPESYDSDLVYCPCHASQFDQFDIVESSFTPDT